MYSFDERRNITVAKDKHSAEEYAASHWLDCANEAIKTRGAFYVALSGGSTPAAIYKLISSPSHREQLDWSKVILFWSDERSVPPNNSESNYRMAMNSSLQSLPIESYNIHRMHAEEGIQAAAEYENLIHQIVPEGVFDLIMLGMGEDGHTASLFPNTEALQEEKHLVVMNYVPEKSTWRMTFTYPCINKARNIAIYVLGPSKAEMIETIFKGPYLPKSYPIQRIGTKEHPAMWILDTDAAAKLTLPASACLF